MSAETLKAIDADNRLSVPERTLKPHKLLLIGGAIIGVTAVIFGHHLLFSPAAAPPSSSPTAPAMTVTVIRPEKMASMVSLQLPGQLQAYTEAPIYAQTSGYLQAWYFDIGAKVKANDILGQIDTPAEISGSLSCGTRSRVCSDSASTDDGDGHDHRHGADGVRLGRGWRAKCASGSSGHRRFSLRNRGYIVFCSDHLYAGQKKEAG
jgi:hypothetical protein